MKRAFLSINLTQLKANLAAYQALAPHKTIIAVVKCNAYGHDAALIAPALESCGVRYFAVATVAEALQLRMAKVRSSILIMGRVEPSDLPLCSHQRFQVTIHSIENAQEVMNTTWNGKLQVQIKVDTGLHRIGLDPTDLLSCFQMLSKNPRLSVTGVYSHFLGGKEFQTELTEQNQRFFESLYTLPLNPEWMIHMESTNSIGLFNNSPFNAVRIGLGLYGLDCNSTGTAPIASLHAPIIHRLAVKQGDKAGYDGVAVAPSDGYFYTLALGYGDGFRKDWYSNGRIGTHILKSTPAISMDALILYSPTRFEVGENVSILDSTYSYHDLARDHHLLVYEVSTSFSPRLERIPQSPSIKPDVT